MWFACLLCLYLTLSLLSAGLQLFVVYGRVVRSLAPFVALACAYGFHAHLWRYGRGALIALVAGLGILSISNFVPAILQQYPLEIAWEVYQTYDDVSFETTVETTENPVISWWDLRPEAPDARYKLFNAANYYPIEDIHGKLPDGEILLEVSHPFNYEPWQYEGMTPAMRDMVNRSELAIWLIDTQPSSD